MASYEPKDHIIYDNEVLENKITDLLITAVDLSNYMTVDNSLTQNAGMRKVINRYTARGNVEDLAMGEGNTGGIMVSFDPVEYTVGTTQGRFAYFDEQAMTDPMVVDVGLDGLAKTMVNDFTNKAIDEFENSADLGTTPKAWSFEAVVDGIAKMNLEDESGLFLLISPADQAAFRKALKDDLKYVESFVRTGYIGSVCGVPVIVSKAVAPGVGFLATKDAITLFVKKDTEIEQERDANVRKNTVYARKVAVVALTDATKLVKIDLRHYTEAETTISSNPAADGYYELTANGAYVPTKDTTPVDRKTYFTETEG